MSKVNFGFGFVKVQNKHRYSDGDKELYLKTSDVCKLCINSQNNQIFVYDGGNIPAGIIEGKTAEEVAEKIIIADKTNKIIDLTI
ncbi:MAG: hypothetical protein PHV68_07665 [Candidatus Gastranaerophilales bacterium]|nr:hypothetical protein [Candidatus Gastranaerophilales bacterium]